MELEAAIMKLITLNIWGGHVRDPLLNFISAHRATDIFCFQEVYHNAPEKISTEERPVSLNIFSELQTLLPEHNGYFRPVVDNVFGIATFIKKEIDVLSEGEITIHENPTYIGRGPTHSRNMQFIECKINHKNFSVLNVHGLWNGKGKTDSPERIHQSKRIKRFMKSLRTPIILCGDFNLKPDTESLNILEEGMINLVKIHAVTSTRTNYYPKAEKFADYILISEGITTNRFEVMPDEVSDHAPLFLEFN